MIDVKSMECRDFRRFFSVYRQFEVMGNLATDRCLALGTNLPPSKETDRKEWTDQFPCPPPINWTDLSWPSGREKVKMDRPICVAEI